MERKRGGEGRERKRKRQKGREERKRGVDVIVTRRKAESKPTLTERYEERRERRVGGGAGREGG